MKQMKNVHFLIDLTNYVFVEFNTILVLPVGLLFKTGEFYIFYLPTENSYRFKEKNK